MRRAMLRSEWMKLKRHWILALMIVPGMGYLVLNNYLPMVGVIIAFKNIDYSYNGLLGKIIHSEWIGFSNFEYLFQSSDAWTITRNTILYNGTFIVLTTIVAVALAILLNEVRHRFFSRLYQSVILLPYLLSMVVVSYFVLAMLNEQNGFINKQALSQLGMEPISWYTEAKYWPYILTFVHLWKTAGYLCIVYLASIVGIDAEYYEAATVDGASRIHQIRMITVPLLKPTIVVMMLLAVGQIFYADFGLFYQVPLNSGAIQPTTDVIDTYVYRGLMKFGDIGMSSAAGLYQSTVGFVLVLLTNYMVRRRNRELALF
ncbi:ABC transporter permease [Cohnella hashimotonis]|uniref:ABC transporter permease subunit n=1 Tax=Cohnella hashimotonis TaxID=2826895 RepID=A0ABT6T9N3_9BACL|nr:ABC transporter permease subunit [Cohnella hashimotonis]MDI4643532.1 ABC transporter permease subunit [Cohnella hashimotonis]